MSGVLARLRKLDIAEKLTIFTMAVALIPVFMPIPLPIPISRGTRDYYNELLKIRDGKGVMVEAVLTGPSEVATPGTGYIIYPDWTDCLIENLCKLKIKIVFATFQPGGDQNYAKLWDELAPWKKKYGYKYGVDYVIMPYIAGEEVAIASFAADCRVTKADYYGNDLSTLPLMKDIRTLSDFSLASVGGVATWSPAWVRQWGEKYGIRMIYTSSASWMSVATWYGTRYFGYIETYGEIGMAEYEFLTGFPGDELIKIQMSDAFVLVFLPAIYGLFIYGNLRKRRPRLRGVT